MNASQTGTLARTHAQTLTHALTRSLTPSLSPPPSPPMPGVALSQDMNGYLAFDDFNTFYYKIFGKELVCSQPATPFFFFFCLWLHSRVFHTAAQPPSHNLFLPSPCPSPCALPFALRVALQTTDAFDALLGEYDSTDEGVSRDGFREFMAQMGEAKLKDAIK